MPTRHGTLKGCALLAAFCILLSTGFAKMEQWTDTQGKSFKAEPAEVVGPFALFRLPDRSGKLLLLEQLGPQDCARFAAAVRDLPAPAADWAQSRTGIGSEIAGSAMRVQDGKLVTAVLKGTPEPRFLILFYANNGEPNSWAMLGKTKWHFQELQKKYPGLVEGFMFGVKHSSSDHRSMAANPGNPMPYLISDFDDQYRMTNIGKLVPNAGYGVVVCNCNGVPLFFSKADTDESAKAVFAQIGGILDLLRADNPAAWAGRLHFWKAAQPALHAADTCEPLLVGDPVLLKATVLRENGVKAFEATVSVSAEGAVTGVALAPGGSYPEGLGQPIVELIRNNARFVPAVDHGRSVAGSYAYRFGE